MKKSSSILFALLLLILLPCVAFAYTTGDDYPIEYVIPPMDSMFECWNFANRECTSFAAWCLNSRNGIDFSNQYNIRADGSIGGYAQWGHASHWGDQAAVLGYTVDRNPALGSIYWRESGYYGHVAWVSSLEFTENDVHVWVEEYNGKVTGGFAAFDFFLSDPSYADIRFIHIADIESPAISQYSQPLDGEFYIRSMAFSDRTQGYLSTDGNADSLAANIGVSPYNGQQCLHLSSVQLDNIMNGIMIRPSYSDLAFGSMGIVLNSNGRRVFDSANIQLYTNDAYSGLFAGHWFSASKWILEKCGNCFIIRNKNKPNLVLTVDGSNVLLRTYTDKPNQLWEILPGEEDPTKEVVFGINYYMNSGRTYDNPMDAMSEQIAGDRKHRYEDYTIRTEIPERRGYTFLGWSTDEKATEPDERYSPGKLYTTDAPLNLWAIWKNLSESDNGTISFGHWEQDGDSSNGPEPITWHVLYSEGGLQYIIADKVLTVRPFGGGLQNWERSSLRSWLNRDFYDAAFSDNEKAYIIKRDQLNLGNDFWLASDDRGTSDYVFLPSQREVLRFLPEDSTRRARASTYAINEAGLSSDTEYIPWWIRTNGIFIGQAMQVNFNGSINTDGVYGGDKAGIRPVIWLSGLPDSDDVGGNGGGTIWDISGISDETYEPIETVTPRPTIEPLPTIANAYASATPEPVAQSTNTPSIPTVNPSPTPVAPVSVSSLPVNNTWQDTYRSFILNKEYEQIGYPDYLPDGYDVIVMTDGSVRLEYVGYDYDPVKFSLYDMDNDGTPELLAFNGMGIMAENLCHVYTFKENDMKHIGEIGRRELIFSYSSDRRFPGLVQTDGNMGEYWIDYWYIQNQKTDVEAIESIIYTFDSDEGTFGEYSDDPVITRETDNTELFDWYRNATFFGLLFWDYNEIRDKGWNQFVYTVYQQQIRGMIPDSETDSGESNRGPSPDDTPETSIYSDNDIPTDAYIYQEVQLDTNTYPGNWNDTYLEILKTHEIGIRTYEERLRSQIEYYADYSPLDVLFYDLNGDKIPEMLFIDGARRDVEFVTGNLYIYSNDGSVTRCVISVPEVHLEAGVGEGYSISLSPDGSVLYVKFITGLGSWQLEYDIHNSFSLKHTLREYVDNSSGDDWSFVNLYYLDAVNISEETFKANSIYYQRDNINILANLAIFPVAVSTSIHSYDEALSSLSYSDTSTVSGHYTETTLNTGMPVLTVPVVIFSDTEIYHAGNPITFTADILGGVPPFTVTWSVEESMVIDNTPLQKYISKHPEYTSRASYTTSERHLEFTYTPPVDSTTLFGVISIVDSNGITTYPEDENIVEVYSPIEGNPDIYPFTAYTQKSKVNIRKGPDIKSKRITQIVNAGTAVVVLSGEIDSDGTLWYYVRLDNGSEGFVRADLVN